MNSIIPAPAVALEVSRALAKGADARAPTTQRHYRKAFERFKLWARARSLPVLPTTPRTLVTYLSWLQDEGLGVSSIRLAKSAIFAAHKANDYPDPIPMGKLAESMTGIIKTARRAHQVTKAHALTPAEVRAMCETTDVRRNRAIICLAFVAALRRSEFAGLRFRDIEFGESEYIVTIRTSKTSDVAQSVRFARGYASDVLDEWIQERGTHAGPLFPSRNKGKGIGEKRVNIIIKACAALAGIEGVTGHSGRRGFASWALANGATVPQVAEVTRHSDPKTVLGYADATGPLPKIGI